MDMSASIFANVEMAPRDPILGLTEAFNADTRTEKVNLGVGVYQDDNGKIPLLACVKAAEKARVEAGLPRGYQPIEGAAAYNGAVQSLLFGADITEAQWGEVVEACRAQKLVPFLDIAYQGFGDGPEADTAAVRMFAASGMQFVVASSFSKNFSLYGERVGALSIVTESKEEAARVLSQVKRVIRTNYSNPPTHGGIVAAAVLNSPELRKQWEEELAGMRDRIRAMRTGLVDKLKAAGVKQDFSFVIAQRGMFSYTGLTKDQVDRLREEFGIYAVGTGRICLAALNSRNIDYVAKAIAAVVQ
jgi:aromatic-amino-acid transaminase